jgi:hypothetical protein
MPNPGGHICQAEHEMERPMTRQTYLFLLGWAILVAAATDGVAAIIFHVQ